MPVIAAVAIGVSLVLINACTNTLASAFDDYYDAEDDLDEAINAEDEAWDVVDEDNEDYSDALDVLDAADDALSDCEACV